MEGQSFRAVSASFFCGAALAPRKVPSQTTRIFASESWIRTDRASELKPPKTTLWTAPIRAQASMAIPASGTIGM